MAPDPREHIAHTPKYTASADDLARLADDARTAANYCWRSGECVLPGGHDEPCSWGLDPEDEDD